MSTLTTNDYGVSSIAFDGSGILHVAAGMGEAPYGLVYLEDNAGVVTETVVDSTSLAGRPSIGVAPSGQSRIAYPTGTGLSFASLSGGTWTTSEIWTGLATGPRLSVDASGFDHIVWATQDPNTGVPGGFFYATDSSGSWVVTQLSTNQDDASPAIATDSLGVVHIVYVHSTRHHEALLELRSSGASWKSVTLVRGSVDVPEIVIGPSDSEHVAYELIGTKAQGLHYLTNASGRFVDVFADPNGFDNGPIPLAVTPTGKAYITELIIGSCCPATGGLVVVHD